MTPMNEETIAGGAVAAADELSAITEPFEALIKALRRLSSTQIVGSDEEVKILNQQRAPALYKMARDLRTDRRLKKMRSLAASCRPMVEKALETLTLMEKEMRDEDAE